MALATYKRMINEQCSVVSADINLQPRDGLVSKLPRAGGII